MAILNKCHLKWQLLKCPRLTRVVILISRLLQVTLSNNLICRPHHLAILSKCLELIPKVASLTQVLPTQEGILNNKYLLKASKSPLVILELLPKVTPELLLKATPVPHHKAIQVLLLKDTNTRQATSEILTYSVKISIRFHYILNINDNSFSLII